MGRVRIRAAAAAALLGLLALTACEGSNRAPDPSATAIAIPVAAIQATTHPLVARLTVSGAPAGSSVVVEFGPDTSYGRTTSAVTAGVNGSATLLVAGMRPGMTYHMRARVMPASGTAVDTADATFITGALPANLAALDLQVATGPGGTPQPGIELVNPIIGGVYQPYAIDLQGNVIWYYPWPDYAAPLLLQGIKQMPNGNFLAVIGETSQDALAHPVDRTASRLREINLAGETVREITVADLNTRLLAAGHNVPLEMFHHDVEILPNGHWLVLSNTIRSVSGTPVLADVVVELDSNLNPVFVWNEFDHFDTNFRPMNYPDWTHSNAVVYSPSDGNFLVSLRHLHWVVKVDFRNGAGNGAVLWRLGPGGDFTLVNGTAPTDWQYAQHTPLFASAATAGVFDLIVMDNGNNRIMPTGGRCGTTGNGPCYTTVPLFRIDELARTATVLSRVTLPTAQYSSFAGSSKVLPNGNFEYALSGIFSGSVIHEVKPDAGHALVWSLTTVGSLFYRAERLPSLYRGVTWN